MLDSSRKNNECANMEIETAAMLTLLVTCRQGTMPGLRFKITDPSCLNSCGHLGVYTFIFRSQPALRHEVDW